MIRKALSIWHHSDADCFHHCIEAVWLGGGGPWGGGPLGVQALACDVIQRIRLRL